MLGPALCEGDSIEIFEHDFAKPVDRAGGYRLHGESPPQEGGRGRMNRDGRWSRCKMERID